MENFRSDFVPDTDLNELPQGWRHILMDVVQTLLLSLILFFGINMVSARIRIESVSMENTLIQGDFVLVNKVAYQLGSPKLGDVIVFEPPFDSPEPYIKRVIGLPGDEVIIRDGEVYINGALITEPYIKAKARTNGTYEVPEDTLFVMGDNRNNSSDSRSWGAVPIENVIGRAEFVYLPIEHWGALHGFAVAADQP